MIYNITHYKQRFIMSSCYIYVSADAILYISLFRNPVLKSFSNLGHENCIFLRKNKYLV